MQVIDNRLKGSLPHEAGDYPEGLVIVVDKPWRWTSADVIRKIKFAAIRHFGKRNLKVGHAGTLDPLATGVLLVCVGNACKNAEKLQASEKVYVADVCFGATTPSYDREKAIDRRFSIDGVSEQSVRAVLPEFVGEQEQVAPLFSAKQVDGVRAYELARKLYASGGKLDEAAAEILNVSRINISEMELLNFGRQGNEELMESGYCSGGASSRINVEQVPIGLPVATIRVKCSKGTYIRALARDIGERLGSGAFLTGLRRTNCGEFSVQDACSVNDVLKLLNESI